MNTYDLVVKAAQRLVTDDTRDTWGLANAVLVHVPEIHRGGNEGRESLIASALASLASDLAKDGVTTPNGDGYSPSSLHELRKTAMAWDESERFPEAAYRTHQEAGGPNTPGGKILAALVEVARDKDNPPPKPTIRWKNQNGDPRSLSTVGWDKAVARIQTRAKGFPVAANDLRVAKEQKPNVPGPSRGPVTPQDVKDAIDSGDLSPKDVAGLLPSNTLVDEWAGRREDETVGPLTDGMTGEEVDRSNQMIGALQSAVDSMQGMAKGATEGWWQHDVIHAQNDLVSVLRYVAPDMGADLIQFLIEHTDEIRRVLDMIEMKAKGASLPDEVSNWLAEQTAS